mgnify:CR=1 FL=1
MNVFSASPKKWEDARSLWTWTQTNTNTVAPLSAVLEKGASPVERSNGAEWPPPSNPDAPITIELIRNANDEWRVCVEGQLCPEAMSEDYASIQSCELPPPLSFAQKLSVGARARRVIVACRMKKDSLRLRPCILW